MMYQVIQSRLLSISFEYTDNHCRLAPASPQLISAHGLTAAAIVGNQPVLERQRLGPHIFVRCNAELPILPVPGKSQRVSEMKLPFPLKEQLRKNKSEKWRQRRMNAWFIEYQQQNSGQRVCSVLYEDRVPIPRQSRANGANGSASGRVRNGVGSMGKIMDCILCSTWYADPCQDRVEHTNFVRVFYKVPQFERFPSAPCDILDFETARNLRAGDHFGVHLSEDRPLALGFDVELEKLGFLRNSQGYNCVTDWGVSYSFPLRCPSKKDWESLPLPLPLETILAMKDTPEHSWEDVVRGFIGHRVSGIEIGPKNGGSEPLDPTAAVCKTRSSKVCASIAQPCYSGPSEWIRRIGRYSIFAIRLDEELCFLLDSNWRDKEVALHLFATEKDAVDYCFGKRGHQIGWKAHNEGWDDQNSLKDWMRRCVARYALSLGMENQA